MSKLLVICNGKTCSRDGSKQLLNFIEQQQIEQTKIITQYCFGECGNGPVILVLPEKILHFHANQQKLSSILSGHENKS